MPSLWDTPLTEIQASAEAFKGAGWRAVSAYKSHVWADVLLRNADGTRETVVTVFASGSCTEAGDEYPTATELPPAPPSGIRAAIRDTLRRIACARPSAEPFEGWRNPSP